MKWCVWRTCGDCVWYQQRTLSGEQYSLAVLGQRRASAANELLYTSLLPSAGPTKLRYMENANGDLDDLPAAYHKSSRSGSISWNSDLDGGPHGGHRRGTYGPTDFSDLDSFSQRRGSQASHLGDYDNTGYIYRRPTKDEVEEMGTNYNAVMPYNPVVLDDVIEPAPLCRSDTVAKLMDKYTNFKPHREFSHRAPHTAPSRSKKNNIVNSNKCQEKSNGLVDDDDEDESGFTASERALLPPPKGRMPRSRREELLAVTYGRDRSRSSTPLGSRESKNQVNGDSLMKGGRGWEGPIYNGQENGSVPHESSGQPSRSSRFSNIYEDDEDDFNISRPQPKHTYKPPVLDDDLDDDISDYQPGAALKRYREQKARGSNKLYGNDNISKGKHDKASSSRQKRRGNTQPPEGMDDLEDDDTEGALTRILNRRYGKGVKEAQKRLPMNPYEEKEQNGLNGKMGMTGCLPGPLATAAAAQQPLTGVRDTYGTGYGGGMGYGGGGMGMRSAGYGGGYGGGYGNGGGYGPAGGYGMGGGYGMDRGGGYGYGSGYGAGAGGYGGRYMGAGGYAPATSGYGMAPSGYGMSNPGYGTPMPSYGMGSTGYGMTNAATTAPAYGMATPNYGMATPGMGMTTPGMGMTTPNVGMTTPGLTNPVISGAGASRAPRIPYMDDDDDDDNDRRSRRSKTPREVERSYASQIAKKYLRAPSASPAVSRILGEDYDDDDDDDVDDIVGDDREDDNNEE
ncbi:hypothetical protein Pmani_037888 [Petrolisthes manimaculis]|uniref:Uncharacterized protein n=1 Tax=Petrolisthes manimaculis TaxID=1843537 RepID=A0AAE1TMV9_9EUCA|nr:hypothetical protein Pmani_037888 [Petrolisthes manimaculis]